HYVGVRQMATLLEPFVKDQTTVRVDDLRNLLILSGTELELKHLLATVEMFDINWMAGMSAGLFTLQSADVKSVTAELDKALGTPAGTIVSAPSYQAAPTSAVPVVPPTPTQTATQAASAAAAAAAATRAVAAGEGGIGVIRNVQVVADKDNNTVLIVATPTE